MLVVRVLPNHIKGLQVNLGDLSDLILITRITADLTQTLRATLFLYTEPPNINYEIDTILNQTKIRQK